VVIRRMGRPANWKIRGIVKSGCLVDLIAVSMNLRLGLEWLTLGLVSQV